jgi:chromosome partitioning protein
MRTLAVFSQKGGSGKTTLSINLAVQASRHGLKAALVDADPQGSAVSWAKARTAGSSPLVARANSFNLSEVLTAAKNDEFALVVLDCPPHDEVGSASLLQAADFVLIPCRPSALDVAAARRPIDLARAAGKPHAFVINAAPLAAPEIDDARQVLAGLARVAPTILTERRAYFRALTAGQAVSEFEPKGKAADELESLYEWIQEEMKL